MSPAERPRPAEARAPNDWLEAAMLLAAWIARLHALAVLVFVLVVHLGGLASLIDDQVGGVSRSYLARIIVLLVLALVTLPPVRARPANLVDVAWIVVRTLALLGFGVAFVGIVLPDGAVAVHDVLALFILAGFVGAALIESAAIAASWVARSRRPPD